MKKPAGRKGMGCGHILNNIENASCSIFLEKAIILARQYPKENTRKYVKI